MKYLLLPAVVIVALSSASVIAQDANSNIRIPPPKFDQSSQTAQDIHPGLQLRLPPLLTQAGPAQAAGDIHTNPVPPVREVGQIEIRVKDGAVYICSSTSSETTCTPMAGGGASGCIPSR
jgi:hypothetical protein